MLFQVFRVEQKLSLRSLFHFYVNFQVFVVVSKILAFLPPCNLNRWFVCFFLMVIVFVFQSSPFQLCVT